MSDAEIQALTARLKEAEVQAGRLVNTLILIFYFVGAAALFWIDGFAVFRRYETMHDVFRFFCAVYGVGGIPAAGWLVEKIKHSKTWA